MEVEKLKYFLLDLKKWEAYNPHPQVALLKGFVTGEEKANGAVTHCSREVAGGCYF